ncbi:unnamed protein product [Cercopithifilaria johnstoni]|uniref:Protein kinase domain-containing protein n=1 Tax=Cercopithifilaria johnstoni TaxID=2874296 RepID=A0A8J2Q6B9_9BILA|nr:unnamed protein product [Cercopithifilaria johnstoni]
MPIVNRLKKFILGSNFSSDSQKSSFGSGTKTIPDIVRVETDVCEYWILDEVIGDGAFGSVYKARSKLESGRVAAAKAMELEDDESQDVMVEVSILTQCKHPNIVELYDAFTMGNRITLLLEYCGGGAVDSIMMELSRHLTEQQIHYIMKEILKALNFLHGKNVIHRDLKAGNVLLTSDARVKLADFGVSALCKDGREVRSTFIGTPYWMAPEVMLCETFPEKHYNKLADIWSFGITLIEMAEEKPPYAEMNPAKVIFKVIKADPPMLERPNLWSPNFRAVVTKCLTKDPGNRPSAADVLMYPFFAQSGSVQCIRSLISEVNAEQITTEVVVGSDDEGLYDDEDDDDTATLSSVATTSEVQAYDANSASSKQCHSVLSATEQKIPPEVTAFTSKSTIMNAGSTTVVELAPAAEISPICIETNDVENGNILSSLLSGKKQRAPSLPTKDGGILKEGENTIAIVEISADDQGKLEFLERSDSVESCKSSKHGHHHAAVIALSDLDKALNLEEELFCENRGNDDQSPVLTLSPSPDFLSSECSDPTMLILSASEAAPSVSGKVENTTNLNLNVLSKPEVKDIIGVELELGRPESAHHIRDIVSEEQLHVHLLGRPTTVQITETGAVVTTSNASLNKKLVETDAQVKLDRPNAMQEASFVHMLKVEDSQQLKVKVFTKEEVAVPESIPVEEFRSSKHQNDYAKQPNIPKIEKKKDAVAYKSFDSLLKIDSEESASSTATQRCLSQPQACSRHLIQVGPISAVTGTNYSVGKLPLGVSLSTDHLNAPATRTIYMHIPDSILQSSPILENKQLLKHQNSVRADFKVPLSNAKVKVEARMTEPSNLSAMTATMSVDDKGIEKTVIEIRRPLSYPESNSKQTSVRKAVTVSSSCAGSSPLRSTHLFSRHSAVVAAKAIDHARRQEQNRNIIRDQNRNRKRLITERNQESNAVILKNISEQKKDNTGDQNGTLPTHHQLTPTTSNKKKEMQLEHEYDYFGTASSSSSGSSKHFQRHNYEGKLGERDGSSFLAAVAPNGGVTSAVSEPVSIPRAVLTIAPPEPPVDYYENNIGSSSGGRKSSNSQQRVSANKKSIGNGTKAPNTGNGTSVVGSRRSPHRQTVTKKTRVYVVDGVQMTSTSHQVFGVKQDYELRKQQLHELRRLQREEARQQRELNAKAEALRNEQIKRFAADKENIYKKTDIELQMLARTQKRQLKECEEIHNEDMKQSLKRMQSDQERELRMFREQLKQEQRDLKMEIDTLPKSQRKDCYRVRKEQLDGDQQKREMNFVAEQQCEQAARMTRVQLDHKMKILHIEKNFQQQKHAVLRSREASEWDLEEKQLAERHHLNKQELKDRFYLQRTQMLARHQRELDHMRRVNEMDEEEQIRLYASFKKRLPKDFRTESKTRIAMFKESLRISCQKDDPATLNEKIRAFEEKEKQRIRNALEEHDTKYARKLRELKEKNATAIRELEEIHSEKRKMLLEAEENKMEMYEKEYEQVIADWKAGLPIRKQALEAEFTRELDEVEAFYRKENTQLQQLSTAISPNSSMSSRQEVIVGPPTTAVIGNSVP